MRLPSLVNESNMLAMMVNTMRAFAARSRTLDDLGALTIIQYPMMASSVI